MGYRIAGRAAQLQRHDYLHHQRFPSELHHSVAMDGKRSCRHVAANQYDGPAGSHLHRVRRAMKTMNQAASRRSAMRGFTLVELMIAILIGLFLTAGLLTLVGAMKRTTTTQTSMSQLQDSERIAMSLIATVVETAGYFPNPAVNSATTFFLPTSTGPLFPSGRAITGAANGTLGDS